MKLIPYSTKRVVRKRVRRGTFSPGGSRNNGGGSATGRGSGGLLSFGGGRRSQALGGNSQVASQLGQTVSFAEREDPRSIHQRLGVGAENERKGSLTTSIIHSVSDR